MNREFHSSCLRCLMREYLDKATDFEVVCANGHSFNRTDMRLMMEA